MNKKDTKQPEIVVQHYNIERHAIKFRKLIQDT